MNYPADESSFNRDIRSRIVTLRTQKGWTQLEMANALGLPFERYKKYETRSTLPAYLIPRFAQIMDSTVEFVMTGRRVKVSSGADN